MDDAQAVVDYARAQHGDVPLVLAGFSFGSYVAAQLRQRIDARHLIMLGAAVSPKYAMPHVPADTIVIHGEHEKSSAWRRCWIGRVRKACRWWCSPALGISFMASWCCCSGMCSGWFRRCKRAAYDSGWASAGARLYQQVFSPLARRHRQRPAARRARLPAVRELAARHNVSLTTARRVVKSFTPAAGLKPGRVWVCLWPSRVSPVIPRPLASPRRSVSPPGLAAV